MHFSEKAQAVVEEIKAAGGEAFAIQGNGKLDYECPQGVSLTYSLFIYSDGRRFCKEAY